MKIIKSGLLLLLSVVCLFAQKDWSKIYNRFEDKIVLVSYYEPIASFEDIKDKERIKRYLTGIVVRPDGLILTSSRIFPANIEFSSSLRTFASAKMPTEIKVKFSDGQEKSARFVGKDDDLGVAFIQLKESAKLEVVKFKKVKSLAIGTPILVLQHLPRMYDFTLSIVERRVNARIKKNQTRYYFEDNFVGLGDLGLVLNWKGEALGIYLKQGRRSMSRLSLEMGGGSSRLAEITVFDRFARLIQKPPVFRQKETKRKKWLGVYIQPFNRDLARYFGQSDLKGVLVNTVIKNSPAESAGLLPGDVITQVNGKDVQAEEDSDIADFRQLIRNLEQDTIVVRVFRQNHYLGKKVNLRGSPISQYLAEEVSNEDLGFSVKELTRDIILAKNLEPQTSGVWVSRVEQAGWADVAGLQIGDLLKAIDDHPLQTVNDVREVFKKISQEHPAVIKLFIERQGRTRFLFIKTKYK